MPVWKYNERLNLKVDDKKVTEYRVDVSNETPENTNELFGFTEDMPYIMDLSSYKFEFGK